MILNDKHQYYNIYSSLCTKCKHFDSDEIECLAFPDGIPDIILEGKEKHLKPFEGQTGATVFEAR